MVGKIRVITGRDPRAEVFDVFQLLTDRLFRFCSGMVDARRGADGLRSVISPSAWNQCRGLPPPPVDGSRR